MTATEFVNPKVRSLEDVFESTAFKTLAGEFGRLADAFVKTTGGNSKNEVELLKQSIEELAAACRNGDAFQIAHLIDAGAPVNYVLPDHGSMLHLAALSGHAKCVQVLLDKRADATILDSVGQNVLHKAGVGGDPDTVRLLLERCGGGGGGGQLLLSVTAEDRNGVTPLHAACCGGSADCLEAMLNADPAQSHGLLQKHGLSMLHTCCIWGQQECLQRLLDKLPFSILSSQDEFGETALHKAAANGFAKIVEFLLEAGCSSRAETKSRLTPLHCAAFNGHRDCVVLLLRKGALVGCKDREGATPLHKAAFGGASESLVSVLMQAGASLTARDARGSTALHKAAWGQAHAAPLVAQLLALGAPVDAVDDLGGSALHDAAYRGHLAVVDCLLRGGASLELPDKRGRSPLFVAALRCNLDVCRLLIDAGAEVDVHDAAGMSPLLYALNRGHADVARLLVFAGAPLPSPSLLAAGPAAALLDQLHVELLNSAPAPLDGSASLSSRQQKLLKQGIQIFNTRSASKAIRFLVESRLLPDNAPPAAVARFLAATPQLSKKQIGDYLGDGESTAVLAEFVALLDFSSLELDQALRLLLSKFQLPGEAQKIDRVVEQFSRRYHDQNPHCHKLFANSDTVYLLSFAVVMLNTDAHNPRIKKANKMTKVQFLNNCKFINAGGPVDASYMMRLYDRIVANEIKMEQPAFALSDTPDIKGWLFKLGDTNWAWSRRFFILDNGWLHYFKDSSDMTRPHVVIEMRNLEVTSCEYGSRRFCISIRDSSGEPIKSTRESPNGASPAVAGTDKQLFLAAQNQAEREEWITRLLAASTSGDKFLEKIQPRKP